MYDAEGSDYHLVEPDLSEYHLDARNVLLARTRKNIAVLDPDLPPRTTWFGYDHSSLTRKITKILPTSLMVLTTIGRVYQEKNKNDTLLNSQKKTHEIHR